MERGKQCMVQLTVRVPSILLDRITNERLRKQVKLKKRKVSVNDVVTDILTTKLLTKEERAKLNGKQAK